MLLKQTSLGNGNVRIGSYPRLLILSLFLFALVINSSAVFASNTCSQLFCVSDASNSRGNETVTVCAGTPVSVFNFNVWYNGTGPFNLSASNITTALYSNSSVYSEAIGLNNSLGGGCVDLVLKGSVAPFTTAMIEINVSVYNNSNYANASGSAYGGSLLGSRNGSMMTANYVSILTQNTNGVNLSTVILTTFNNVTKNHTKSNPGMTDAYGFWAQHCSGPVSNGNCLNISVAGMPSCSYHGSSFGEGTNCSINTTTTLYAISIVNALVNLQNVTPGTPLVMNLSTSTAMSMLMVSYWSPGSQENGGMNMLSIPMNITDNSTGQLVFSVTSLGGGGPGQEGAGGGMPAFIQPYKIYNLIFSSGGINYNFPFVTPTTGPTGVQIFLPNSTVFPASTGIKTVVGKVLNETNSPVSNAVVYAQFYKGPSGAMGISFFSSAITDVNGRFSLQVPKTRTPTENSPEGMYFPIYQFYIVSNRTVNGIPVYFTTIDNNKNRGYFALQDINVLPPLTLKAGGVVTVNVTLNNASVVLSELNKFVEQGTGVTRDSTTGKFTMVSLFESMSVPANISMSILSPVGSVLVDLFGKNTSMGDPMSGSIVSACINTSAMVTQGSEISIACNLTQQGSLNLTVQTCTSIFDINTSDSSKCISLSDNSRRDRRTGSFNFWFEHNGVIRDSNRNVVLFLSPEGSLMDSLLPYGSSETANLRIPLPPGGYTLELSPAFEFSRYLGVKNSTAFTIAVGQDTNMFLVLGNSWNIEPRFNPSLIFSNNNTVEVSVSQQQGGLLNISNVTLNARVLYPNRTIASDTIISFNYNSSRGVFVNTTFVPLSLGLTAGKYLLMFNVTNKTSTLTYTTTSMMSINAYDFQVGIELGGFTFGTSQVVSGKLYAFNATGPIATNTTPISVQVYDSNGNVVTTAITVTNITNGIALINVTMPSVIGFYEITAAVNASGRFGVADNWVQVSNTNIKTTTDRPKYLPSDTVTLTVQITNSSSGIGIPNASISVVADNSDKTAFGKTDASGKVVMTLDPSSYAGSGSSTWSFGWHNLKIEISKDTGTDVSKTQTWFGFDVRGENDLFIRPDKPVFSQSENVSLTIFGPPANSYSIAPNGIKVDGTTLTQGALNDCSVVSGSTFCMSDSWGKNVNLGNWSAGHHNLEFTISFGQGQQKFYTGFDVSLYNIMVTTDNFTYRTNSNVTLTVKVNHPNGTAVSNANVFATLYKAQPPNDIYVNQTNATTDSTGQVVLRLNASQPGFNYIKVNASGQLQFIGLQVSTIQVSLMSAATGGVVSNYNVAPGDTATIFVNATSGGSAVADGSIVKASTWAFGNQIDLPSNTTTGGISSISYQVPSFAPTQVYGLDVSVTTSGGDQGFAPQSSLTVTGGSAMQLSVSSDRSFMNAYKIGDIALFTATVRYSNGTGVSGQNITFELGSEGSSPQIVGAAITGSTGMASKTYTIGTNDTDGPYFLHAYISNSTDVQSYSGFLVSSLQVNVIPDSTVHGLGETLVLNVTVTNRTSGLQINATSGFAAIFNKEKGAIQQFYDPTRLSQPYRINISIPNETTALGSYPIAVVMFMNNSQGTGFTLIDVRNGSQSLNITLPSTITAGTAFSVNISSLSGAAATLRIFSPSAQQVVYENTSITVTGGSILVPVNISNPGVYVFNAFVTGVGATTKVTTVSAAASGTVASVWTGTSLSANASTFTTAQDVYISSNAANMTATVLSLDTSTNTTLSLSVLLNPSGSSYYGIVNHTNLLSGRNYFVRLDTTTASSLATAMFKVS